GGTVVPRHRRAGRHHGAGGPLAHAPGPHAPAGAPRARMSPPEVPSMSCPEVQSWLLQAEDPADLAGAPAEVARHVPTCAACQALLRSLGRLERGWRSLPLAGAAAAARERFREAQTHGPAVAGSVGPRGPARRMVLRSALASAAVVLVALGTW